MFGTVKEVAATIRVIWTDAALLIREAKENHEIRKRIKRYGSAVDKLFDDDDTNGGA